jgi:hypothetical protein
MCVSRHGYRPLYKGGCGRQETCGGTSIAKKQGLLGNLELSRAGNDERGIVRLIYNHAHSSECNSHMSRVVALQCAFYMARPFRQCSH